MIYTSQLNKMYPSEWFCGPGSHINCRKDLISELLPRPRRPGRLRWVVVLLRRSPYGSGVASVSEVRVSAERRRRSRWRSPPVKKSWRQKPRGLGWTSSSSRPLRACAGAGDSCGRHSWSHGPRESECVSGRRV